MTFNKYAFLALLASTSFEASASENDGILSPTTHRSSTAVFVDAVGGVEDIAVEATQAASIAKTAENSGIPAELEQNASAAGNIVGEIKTDPWQALADSRVLMELMAAEMAALRKTMSGLMSVIEEMKGRLAADAQAVEKGATTAVDDARIVVDDAKTAFNKAKVTCGC